LKVTRNQPYCPMISIKFPAPFAALQTLAG
jgi:hypothetical protein